MAFDQAKADAICARLAEGEPLRVICRDEGMPSKSEVYRWREENAEFAGRFARAREQGFDEIAESTLEIADDARNDWMCRNGKEDAGWAQNGENVQRSKLRIWTRMQLLAKWDPKRYGEKLELAGELSHKVEKVVREVVDPKS